MRNLWSVFFFLNYSYQGNLLVSFYDRLILHVAIVNPFLQIHFPSNLDKWMMYMFF